LAIFGFLATKTTAVDHYLAGKRNRLRADAFPGSVARWVGATAGLEVPMRFADNFNPEWGYLAPAPGFMRTFRIIAVAAAVGATAGGAVVFSLIERPAAEETSVAARTLAPSDETALGTPQAKAALPAQNARAGNHTASLATAESATATSTIARPASVAVLAESPVMTEAAPVAEDIPATADAAPVQKKVTKNQHLAWQHFTWRNGARAPQTYSNARAPLALLPAFVGPGGYPPRGED
jgi:hypothetical protein